MRCRSQMNRVAFAIDKSQNSGASAQATVRAEAADGSRLETGIVQTSLLLLQWPWDSQAKKLL